MKGCCSQAVFQEILLFFQKSHTMTPITHATESCVECSKIIKGRSDKKFCNDYCRNTYNNKRSPTNTPYMKQVNYILRKNRNILSTLFALFGSKAISRHKLLTEGFHFEFYTSFKPEESRYACYDYGYRAKSEEWIVIQRLGDD